MEKGEVIGLIFRYVILISLGLFNLYIFYLIFTPLTAIPSYLILNWLYDAALISINFKNPGAVIFLDPYYASIIPACVAGAAYYFMAILNLSTPMSAKKRFLSLIFLFTTFLVLNITRITLFAVLLRSGFQYFDQAHVYTWYFGSTIMVIAVWFANVLIFRIKDIPIYTDLKNIWRDIFR